jgi:hypothetical protein
MLKVAAKLLLRVERLAVDELEDQPLAAGFHRIRVPGPGYTISPAPAAIFSDFN